MLHPELRTPPGYCGYSQGCCDQEFSGISESQGVFLYASKPGHIAATIQAGVEKIRQTERGNWHTCKDFGTIHQDFHIAQT
jgi:hypothetical protein